MFASVERVIQASDAGAHARDSKPPVEIRRMPLSVLGQARAALIDKVQAHVHQTWLEYGPRAEDVRRANAAVRQCLSDMGTELAIADAADVVHACLTGQTLHTHQQQDPQGAYLYPLALAVPGPQHIVDGLIRQSMGAISWWPGWQADAKVVCQTLHGAGQRDRLVHRLLQNGRNDLADLLRTGCDRFAHWRWKTLDNVSRQLLRMEPAVREAVIGMPAKEVAGREESTAAVFLRATAAPEFWTRCRSLQALVRPLSSFSSWLRGCACHEADRRQGRSVQCPWQGCRAPELADRMRALLAELVQVRGTVDDSWAAPQQEILTAFSAQIAGARLKFHWVNEPPYTVWQARALAGCGVEDQRAEGDAANRGATRSDQGPPASSGGGRGGKGGRQG